MRILLWVLRILLAFWNVTGGIFILHDYEKVASAPALSALHAPVWITLGAIQVLLALCLLLPGAKLQRLTSIAVAALAVISLLGISLYTRYAGFPGMLWGAIPAILEAFVAYERWPNSPKAQEPARS